ncbi:HAMP domain-containing protein [Streptomyces sp. SBST2-5]|uniref:histidine kinase n=1 Tax=Streptomyces composti TaxID=2720025 RepID=A0ABX1A5C4_9ACTN|nr:nitrate- and nitrite sensing domain-containing protein [Streptomyces composti]NJP50267.1 HAMP domain-containing protein [Streptomyces composti]
MAPRTARRRRLGSIRLSLVLLALVPGVTLAAMWSVTTIQMFSEGLRLRSQTELSRSTGAMGTEATLALQRERSLTAAWLASPEGSRSALEAQRKKTDEAVEKLVGQADAIAEAPGRISDRLYSVLGSVGSLEYYRSQVDDPGDITAEQALDQYTSIINDQISAFHELSQVDDGDLTSQAGPLVALEHAAELVSREDAILTLAWRTGRLEEREWTEFTKLVHTRRWLVQDQIVPSLRGSAKSQTERILQSPQWSDLQEIEDKVLAARAKDGGGAIELPGERKRWQAAFEKLSAQYGTLIRQQTDGLLDRSADEARHLLLTAASLSAGGLIALLLCIGMSWRITRSLSRRLRGLRMATLSLAEERLPDVVARLERGEKVDAEAATTPLDYGHDELGQVAQAFNTAQRTAVHTAVELADTRRGFQKIILGIARQSQNLVNLQLSKLDALERRHTDPEVLKDLYELDSTASQLRRYEENLVVVSGERPGRTWSEPVALIDILRSAVGEVAEYQRVEVHTEEEVCLAPPAVADVIHLLAELIDNATVYSPAPSPVGVRAAMVAKGLAVEVEDRGLGMSEEDYASLNAQLASPPKFDVVALADDLRLGMFVISQLAHRHGIQVTLRASPYGGTTAIVLIPHDVVVQDTGGPAADGAGEGGRHKPVASAEDRTPAPARTPGAGGESAASAADGEGVRDAPVRPATAVAPVSPRADGLAPLPRRVPQTSLAAELREDAPPAAEADAPDDDEFTAERAASSLAGFQRGTLRARGEAAGETKPPEDGARTAAVTREFEAAAEARTTGAGAAAKAPETDAEPQTPQDAAAGTKPQAPGEARTPPDTPAEPSPPSVDR